MKLEDIAQCAVPTALAEPIRKVMALTHVEPTSVCRSPEAAFILNKYGKHTQQQLWDASPAQRVAWGVIGTPDRPGTSTHECRSDGIAYVGPAGRRLRDWQCGMDWPNASIPKVMEAFRKLGMVPIHPYASGLEYHHINLVKQPQWLFLPLKLGNRGLWVYVLSSRLQKLGYLKKRSGHFDLTMRQAVVHFQQQHRLTPDGVVGVHTWANVKAASRVKRKKR